MGCGCSGRQKEQNEAMKKILEKKYSENLSEFYPGVKLLNQLDLDLIDSTPFQNSRDSYLQQNKSEIEQKIMIIKKEIENVLLLQAEMDVKRKELMNLFKEISCFLRIEICYADNFPLDSWGFFSKDKFFIKVSVLNNHFFPKLKTKKKDSSEAYWFEVLSWEKPLRSEYEMSNRLESIRKKKKRALISQFKLNSNDYINFEICKYISKNQDEVVGNGLISAGTFFDQEFKEIKLNINLLTKKKSQKEWFTLIVRGQMIIDLHFLLDSQHKILSNYNEVLIKAYRKFVNILNVTPRGTLRKSNIKTA